MQSKPYRRGGDARLMLAVVFLMFIENPLREFGLGGRILAST
jgi:hypothetical protein